METTLSGNIKLEEIALINESAFYVYKNNILQFSTNCKEKAEKMFNSFLPNNGEIIFSKLED